jgi:hypothetical protein
MKTKLWRIFLRALRAVTLAVDDWIQRQEVRLRDKAAMAEFLAEVDPAASAAREQNRKALISQRHFDAPDVLLRGEARSGEQTASASPKEFAGVPADGCTSACPTKARKRTGTRDRLSAAVYGPSPAKSVVIIRKPKPARLRYRAGQFVREA